MNPQDFERRILLAVTGLSPQVITETLYVLAVMRDPPWIPTEIRLVTTCEGARRASLALLSEDPGGFHRLLIDYQLPAIHFDEEYIHVLEDAHGHPLPDIRTPEDNERAADQITDLVRRLTLDPDSAIHASIAGGRKTMGYYLGYAMSLFGRPQDALSHVLVSEPFESSWEFFYPTPYNRVIELRDKQLANTRDAKVTLAEIPFVRLRQGLDERLLNDESVRFSEVVEAANASLSPPRLIIDCTRRRVNAGGKVFSLPPICLALLVLFARRAQAGEPPMRAPDKNVPDTQWAERFLNEYRQLLGPLEDGERTIRALKRGMNGDYFSQLKSRLTRELEKYLGSVAAAPYQIQGKGRPPRFALYLPPESIRFEEIPDQKETPGRLRKAEKQPSQTQKRPEEKRPHD